MEIKVITDISTEPVTLAVVKNRIKAKYGTDAKEDDEISSMITAARSLIENYCDRTLAQKTIEIFYHADEVMAKRVRLPAGPHKSIADGYPVRINQSGTETALTLNSDYYKRGNQFWELEFLTSTVNPWSYGGITDDDYEIRLTAGYGITNYTEDLPAGFSEAIKKQVLMWYHNQFDGELDKNIMKELEILTGNIWL